MLRSTNIRENVASVSARRHSTTESYLIVPVLNGEVTDDGDHLVQQVLLLVLRAVPQEVAGDVPELEGDAFGAQQALSKSTKR